MDTVYVGRLQPDAVRGHNSIRQASIHRMHLRHYHERTGVSHCHLPGAKIQDWSGQRAILRQGKYLLEMQLLEQKAHPLRAPSEGDMCRTVHESLCAKVRYCFWRDDKLLLDHTDAHAGFEYANS